jgi:RNA polymerase-binding protein DksA
MDPKLMYYIVRTEKSVGDAARDLEAAVRKHSFGVLHVFDLKDTLTKKGYPLGPQCKIFEICNPEQATRVLQRDMRLNMALPCRISVFEDEGTTKIGMILPAEMLRALSHDRELGEIADAVEGTIKAIVDEAASPLGPRDALLLRRATLAREVHSGAQRRAAERDSNVPDSGELAADALDRDVAIAEIDRDAAEIEAIDAALDRLDTGTYGRCTECGLVIAPARLAQHPEAARCITCQQNREQRATPRNARL